MAAWEWVGCSPLHKYSWKLGSSVDNCFGLPKICPMLSPSIAPTPTIFLHDSLEPHPNVSKIPPKCDQPPGFWAHKHYNLKEHPQQWGKPVETLRGRPGCTPSNGDPPFGSPLLLPHTGGPQPLAAQAGASHTNKLTRASCFNPHHPHPQRPHAWPSGTCHLRVIK